MNDILVDIRKFDLADRLGKDMISVDALLSELEDALDKIEELKEEIEDLKTPNEEDMDGIMDDRRLGIL